VSIARWNLKEAPGKALALFDPDFSESSQEFRPGRSGWQAAAQAREYVGGAALGGGPPASYMNEAFPKRFLDDLGLVSLLDYLRLSPGASGTAVYGTVRTVV
jgi:hypothetical protein